MEAADLELIEKHRKDNYDLDRLMKDHESLEQQISKLESAKGLGAEEEKKLHNLKKEKLQGRDAIEKFLTSVR